MKKNSRIYVAGHTGLLGSAACRVLRQRGYANLVLRDHGELELTDQAAVDEFFRAERPEYVFLLAGLTGGIQRNNSIPAEMIHTNLAIEVNVIHLACVHGVKKLLFPGSACSYPKECPSPILPEAMMTAPLERTSEPFAVAKIAGIRMCQAYNRQYGTKFISVIPATTYGPKDHFDDGGHVVASLMARCHAAKVTGSPELAVWGTGRPRREFLYADDAAEAMAVLMETYEGSEIIHIGAGQDISIAELARQIADVVGYQGRLAFDATKPDGTSRRLLDSRRIAELGWRPRTSLTEGLRSMYSWYRQNVSATVHL